MTRYSTIMADPPWPYAQPGLRASKTHRPKSFDSPTGGTSAAARYPLMSLPDIKSLRVSAVAAENAHLYLWTTNSFMVEAHEVASAWGFVPKTIITWVKHKVGRPSDDALVDEGLDAASMKIGYWFRSASEHCLFCVRGSLQLKDKVCLPTWFGHKRLPHSEKPEAFRQLVMRASPGPYLEMFARRRVANWDAFGNEIVGSVTLPIDPFALEP